MNTLRIRIDLLNVDGKISTPLKFHFAVGHTKLMWLATVSQTNGFLPWDMQRQDIGSHILDTDGLPEYIKNMRFHGSCASDETMRCSIFVSHTHQNQDVTVKFVWKSIFSVSSIKVVPRLLAVYVLNLPSTLIFKTNWMVIINTRMTGRSVANTRVNSHLTTRWRYRAFVFCKISVVPVRRPLYPNRNFWY